MSFFGARPSELHEGGEGEFAFVVLGVAIQNPPKLPAGSQAFKGADALRLSIIVQPTEKQQTRAGTKPQPQIVWVKLSDKKKSVFEQWVTKLTESGIPQNVQDSFFDELKKVGNDKEAAAECWRGLLAGRTFVGQKRTFDLGEGINESKPVLCFEKWTGKLDLNEAVKKHEVDIKVIGSKYADPMTAAAFPIKLPTKTYWQGAASTNTVDAGNQALIQQAAPDKLNTLIDAHKAHGGTLTMMDGVTAFSKAFGTQGNAAYFEARQEAIAKGLVTEGQGGITKLAQ